MLDFLNCSAKRRRDSQCVTNGLTFGYDGCVVPHCDGKEDETVLGEAIRIEPQELFPTFFNAIVQP